MKLLNRVPFFLWTASFLIAATSVHAAVIERIVAVVNDEAVLLSEIRRRAVPFYKQALAAPTEEERLKRVDKLYREILDRVIDERLIQQAAIDMQVVVNREDEDRAIDNVRSQSGLDKDGFWQAVRAQGFTERSYRQDVRRQLLRLKVLNQRVRGRVNITEDQLRERYQDVASQARRTERFEAAHIFFALEPQASATEVKRVRDHALLLRRKMTTKTFAKFAQELGGSELGWLKQGDLPLVLEQALVSLQPGELSEPIRGPAGFHIFLLRARQKGEQAVPNYAEVREQIYRGMIEQAMAQQEKIFLQELREQAFIERRL